MKKRFLSLTIALLLCFAAVLSLSACDLSITAPECATCVDENGNHKCDVCRKVLSTCEDTNDDHLCELCKERISDCVDKDGDHLCDLCGTHRGSDGNKDHACDFGCALFLGEHTDANKDHLCDYGCTERIGACTDAAEDRDHVCDWGCGKVLTACADADGDDLCDECGKTIPAEPENPENPENPEHVCTDTDKNHACDNGCSETIGKHEDANKDHICDYGCQSGIGDCVDRNKDHTCDWGCGKRFGEHADTVKDHHCDHCNEGGFGEHTDADKDHVCDYGCTTLIGDCTDLPGDGDHICDYGCKKTLSECFDVIPEDGFCEECGEAMAQQPPAHACADENRDHICDNGCSERIGDHLDTDFNHTCDYGCKETIGECTDEDRDHACDWGCSEFLGECADAPADGNHLCDWGCGEALTECTFVNGTCTDCGATSGTEPEVLTYFELVEALRFDDSGCPLWRVAIIPTNASYIFVSRELSKDEWFCGSEILFIMRLAMEMNYKLELVPMHDKASALTALENGSVDALIGAVNIHEFGASIFASETYGANFRAFTNREQDLSMINKAIDFVNSERVYGDWYNAADAYVNSLPEHFIDSEGYDESGEKINGDADLLCNHKDTDNDHYCNKCEELSSYCTDSGNGSCSACGRSVSDIMNPSAPPVFLGMALTLDGEYSTQTPMRVFFMLNKTCTVYYKFSNAVTVEFGFSVAGAPVSIETVQSELGAYIYAASFTVTNENAAHDQVDNIFYRDILREYHRMPNLNYYRIPELIGMADENGVLISGAPNVSAGASFTLRFVSLGEIGELKLYYGGSALEFTLDSTEAFYLTSGSTATPYYLYTVTVTDGDFISIGEGEIALTYTYYGIESGESSPFPSMTLTFYKHADGGEGGGGEIAPPCTSCTDGNGDGFCDSCGQPVESTPHDCTDEADYDGYCDICHEPIEGIEALRTPTMLGYSTEPGGPFEEGGGTLRFELYKNALVYVKFSCPVELLSLSIMDNTVEEWELYSQDEGGCIYAFWTGDIESIFMQRTSEIYFKTPYSEECFAVIQYACEPTVMPELLGYMENGVLTQNAPTLLKGYTYTFSFVLNTQVDALNSIRSSLGDFEIADYSCTQGDTPDTYVYTVTVRDTMGSATDGELELSLYYTYLGAANSEGESAFPPVIFLKINIAYVEPTGVTVNGTNLNTTVQVPFSSSFLFSITFNAAPTDARLEINGTSYSGQAEPSLPCTYYFTVQDLSAGEKELYIYAVNGEYEYMPIFIRFEILGGSEGGEGTGGGNEGGGEGGEILPEDAPELQWIRNDVFEEEVTATDVLRFHADGKIAISLAFSRDVAETYIRANGDGSLVGFGEYYNGSWYYSIHHPMASSMQEGTLEIIVFENNMEIVVATLNFKIAAAEFYGIYAAPGVADIESKPSGVNVAAGEKATVYIATTAAVDPDKLFISSIVGTGADYDIPLADDPWYGEAQIFDTEEGEIFVFFYRIELPAEILVPDEEYAENTHKIAFEIYQSGFETIWMTYTVNYN